MSTSAADSKPDVVVHRLGATADTAALHPSAPAENRRSSGRRARARDRLMDRATRDYTPNAALSGVDDLETMLLFVDDDLRETALALGRIEDWLVRTLGLLEAQELRRLDVLAAAGDRAVLDHVDQLNETLESLRRRLAKLAGRMRA